MHQGRTGLVGFANRLDHFIDVQVDQHTTLQHVDPVSHFVIAILGPAQDRVGAKTNPLKQRLAQPFLTGTFVGANTHQIHRDAGFHAGLRQQGVHEFVAVNARGFGFKD